MADENGFIDWPGSRHVFEPERTVANQATGRCLANP
jgi:hypothetical protein